MKPLSLLVLLVCVSSQELGKAPHDSKQRELWMRMYGVPGKLSDWQGPPQPRSEIENTLGYREHVLSDSEVRERHPGIFGDIPSFHPSFKSPCFQTVQDGFQCLPYGFIIGFPKCATSDLWERLQLHPQVAASNNKETRFLTPAEYGNVSPEKGWIGNHTQLSSFTASFQSATQRIASGDTQLVLLEGTPLTAWWSSQRPDDGLGRQGYDAPPSLFLHALLPSARLIAMVGNPSLRMYSDYWFVGPRKVIMTSQDIEAANRSAHHFHDVATKQVSDFHRCLSERSPHGESIWKQLPFAFSPQPDARTAWVRKAVAECAADRSAFALPGSGRLAVGVYVAHLSRWVGDGPWDPQSLLVLRREDLSKHDSRVTALLRVLRHLGLDIPSTNAGLGEEALRRAWDVMVKELPPQNVWKRDRAAMLVETRQVLSEFYVGFGYALARFVSTDCTQLASSLLAECEHANKHALLLAYDDATSDSSGGRVGQSRSSVDYALRKWSPHAIAQFIPPKYGCHSHSEPLVPATAEMTALLINSRQAQHDSLSLRIRFYTVMPFDGDVDRFTVAVNSEYAVGWHHPFVVEGVEHVTLGKWFKMKDCLASSDWCVYVPSNTAILEHSRDWIGEAILRSDRDLKYARLLEGGIIALKSCTSSLSLVDSVLSGLSRSLEEGALVASFFPAPTTDESPTSCSEDKVKEMATATEAIELLRQLCKGGLSLAVMTEEVLSIESARGQKADEELVWN